MHKPPATETPITEDAATEDIATEDAATEDAATEDTATEDTATEVGQPEPPFTHSVRRRLRFRPAEIWLLLATTLCLAGADQYTKGWVVERLGPLRRATDGHLRPPPGKAPLPILPHALQLTLNGNQGAIFGIGRDWPRRVKIPLFTALSLLAVGFVLLLFSYSHPSQVWLRLGLASVLSGALGNGLDRIRLDYVVDFIDWYAGFRWPTFNVADVAITVGSAVVLLSLWRPPMASHPPMETSP